MFLLPWQFSPTVVTAITVAAALYGYGSSRTSPPVPGGRRTAFYVGLLVVYCALQTGWEYYASHMIFVLQLQHFALHDLAPVLLAWAVPRAALAAGLPDHAYVRAIRVNRAMRVLVRLLLSPSLRGRCTLRRSSSGCGRRSHSM